MKKCKSSKEQCDDPKPDGYLVDDHTGESPCGLIWSVHCWNCDECYEEKYDCIQEDIDDYKERKREET